MNIDPKNKIRNVIIFSFTVFAVLITSIYGALTYLGAHSLEDKFFSDQLSDITEQYLLQLTEKAPEDIRLLKINTYIGTGEMSDSLFNLLGSYPVGYHEIHIENSAAQIELQVTISEIPNSTERLYIVYDVSDVEISHSQEVGFIWILVTGGIFVAVLGIIIGLVIANKITKPINILTKRISEIKDDELPTDLVHGLAKNEIFYLGTTLEDANRRIKKFVQREKEFTRNASHELRTPLAVIKGAHDILQESDSCPSRPLERIGRSIQEMELSIVTFLELAREDTVLQVSPYLAEEICNSCVERLEFLTVGKDLQLEVNVKYPLQINIPKELVSIILSNLIRNSIRHTSGGKIIVLIEKNLISVEDSGSGISKEILENITNHGVRDGEKGEYGYGLNIVEQICEHVSWTMRAENIADGVGARIKIITSRC